MTPTFDDIAEAPGRAHELTRAQAYDLFYSMMGVVMALGPVMLRPDADPAERLLTVADAAKRLGMATDTLRHAAHTEPFASLRGDNGTRKLVFSARRIDEYIRRQTAPPRAIVPVGSAPRPAHRGRRQPGIPGAQERFPLPKGWAEKDRRDAR